MNSRYTTKQRLDLKNLKEKEKHKKKNNKNRKICLLSIG